MDKRLAVIASVAAIASLAVSPEGYAADIKCAIAPPADYNYMEVPDTQVSACVDSGLGNIGQGNEDQDDFLYTSVPDPDNPDKTIRVPTQFYLDGYRVLGAGTFTQNGLTGTWEFPSSYWTTTPLAIGFKFGTGGDPDEWFVYNLMDGIFSGTWEFFEGTPQGGSGLSHVVVYTAPGDRGDDDDDDDDQLPEPGSLALLGLGLMGLGLSRRRRA